MERHAAKRVDALTETSARCLSCGLPFRVGERLVHIHGLAVHRGCAAYRRGRVRG